MADKTMDFRCVGALGWVHVKATLEETRMEHEDTADFCVAVSIDEIPGGYGNPFHCEVEVERAAVPATGTVYVGPASTVLRNMAGGQTKEAHFLVQARTNPRPYNLNITVIPYGIAFMENEFQFPVPEQGT